MSYPSSEGASVPVAPSAWSVASDMVTTFMPTQPCPPPCESDKVEDPFVTKASAAPAKAKAAAAAPKGGAK